MENDEIESEYLGWAVQLTKCSCFDGKVVVTGWETNHGSVRMKKIKQHIINKNKYGLHQNNAVIFAVSNEENETYSEVSCILVFIVSVQINIFYSTYPRNSIFSTN